MHWQQQMRANLAECGGGCEALSKHLLFLVSLMVFFSCYNVVGELGVTVMLFKNLWILSSE